jgi:gamma-glutamyltranspeptidase / glutathione hydrolase
MPHLDRPRPARHFFPLLIFVFFPLIAFPARAAGPQRPLEAQHGMVVSVSAPASEVGVEILKRGGNAVDAAVATAFTLAVTHPAAGNIGGGGFMVIHPGPANANAEPVVIEYRERAPAAASKTMFHKNESSFTHKVVGVPGTVRGLALAHQKFGKLPWKEVVQPAIHLAEDGFVLGNGLATSLNWIVARSKDSTELRRVYGKENGNEDWEGGDLFVQKELAKTLRRIAEEGSDAFYTDAIADQIAAEMKAGGGLITKNDLAAYQANIRKPIHGTYRGYDIYAPPPPSSGGICLVEMLNMLEQFDLGRLGRWSPATLHVMIEVMRRAYCDRARYLGDSNFVKIPDRLTNKEYARTLARFALDRAGSSEDLAPEISFSPESHDTTHFSVIDKDGMAVSNTYTLEQSYGSRIVVHGAGFLLNNEMNDFNWQPGVTTRKGTIGTDANLIAPGKRMLSSQCPTIVARNGKVVLVTGSPGSRTIINTVLCVLVNVLDYHMDIAAAVDAPRLDHEWFPDVVHFEGLHEHPDAVKELRAMGHNVVPTRQGDAHSIWVDPKTGHYFGAEDPRIRGKAVGY